MPFVFRMSGVVLFLDFIHSGISYLHRFTDVIMIITVA